MSARLRPTAVDVRSRGPLHLPLNAVVVAEKTFRTRHGLGDGSSENSTSNLRRAIRIIPDVSSGSYEVVGQPLRRRIFRRLP